MVPQPVLALMLLFPITDDSEAAKQAGAHMSWTSCIALLPTLTKHACNVKPEGRKVKVLLFYLQRTRG